ncbi:MAG: GNAT family N-acetyltransferase [Bacteroidetes bacterium]|nr:GNAT family N-acetyltransferase [Bacteroidota bacterium]
MKLTNTNQTMNNAVNYLIKDGYNEMNFNKVTDMLKNAFWSIGIDQEEVMKGARNSALVVGAFTPENEQIGYARVISDKTRFAYILDVMVDEKFRKQGIGKAMMETGWKYGMADQSDKFIIIV